MTMVMSSFFAGAEIRTLRAPASRCFCAPSRSRNFPVDSITTSTPRSAHGRFAGSRSLKTCISSPSMTMPPSEAETSPG